MKKYFFFIREFNDWDHIAPIIYYLAKKDSSKIYICFYKKDLRYTNLFKYLEKTVGPNLNVFYLPQKKLSFINKFFIKVINKLSSLLKLGKILDIENKTSDNDLERLFEIINVKECNRIIVIFDRYTDSFLQQVQNQLKGIDTIFVTCPHGPNTNVNRMIYTAQMKKGGNFNYLRMDTKEKLLKYFHYYNYLIFTDHIELEFNKKYCTPFEDTSFDKSKIKVLGSIRYCREWLDHVESFTPKIVKKDTGRIKVVFFMKKFKHNVFKDEVYRTIELFASFPNIDFYIKPHTRGMVLPSKMNAPNVHICNESYSSSLIDIADVIFFYGGTSIILEALAKKKFTVCLDYLDANKNIYDHFNACKVFKCRDDLYLFLDSDISNHKDNNKTSGEKILKEIVYAGDRSASVSDRYINFFENL